MADRSANLPENPAENRTLGTSVNDTSGISGNLKRRREQVLEAVEAGDILEEEGDAILAFLRYRRTEDVARNTLTTDLSALRNAAERTDVSLLEMSKSDIEDLYARLVAPEDEGGYGLTPGKGGMYNYKRTLRLFFRWLDSRENFGAYPFWEDLDVPKQEVERQPEDERLTWDDVQTLKAAAA